MNKLQKNILSLKQGVTKYGPAPHKPVLLLAVIQLFEESLITHNWIEPSKELVAAFHDTWNYYVKTEHIPTFALPFYHLKNEKSGIWNLHTYPGKKIQLSSSKSIKSYYSLVETIAGASLKEELFTSLINPVERELIKQQIIERYFPHSSDYNTKYTRYTETIKSEILYDSEVNYARKVKKKIESLPTEIGEQEITVRSHVFRKAILDIYDNQCAISGLKVLFKNNTSLIDACHITPFAESFDDTIRNGIALSPNLHRAFDKGIIAISDDYTILLHKQVRDNSAGYSIKQFENNPINLPNNSLYYPDLDRLKDHRNRFGF